MKYKTKHINFLINSQVGRQTPLSNYILMVNNKRNSINIKSTKNKQKNQNTQLEISDNDSVKLEIIKLQYSICVFSDTCIHP